MNHIFFISTRLRLNVCRLLCIRRTEDSHIWMKGITLAAKGDDIWLHQG